MADSTVAALTSVAAIDGNEVMYLVDDPAGTPLDRKVTTAVLAAYSATVQDANTILGVQVFT